MMPKVLHTVYAMDGGGADRILYDYTIRMLDTVHVDFLVHTPDEGILEKELKNKGCNVFHVPPLHAEPKTYFKKIREIIIEGKYDIIHVAQGYRGLVFMYYANKYRIPVRIAHSHMAYIPESGLSTVKRWISAFVVKHLATHLFACGEDAGKWMWGKRTRNITILHNAIDTQKFVFNEAKRSSLRKQLGIEDKFVIGNVGRLAEQKNQLFLIDVFSEVIKYRADAVLLLIGRGEMEQQIWDRVNELELTDSVKLLGVRDDVSDLLNAMDLFVLPSLYEGLPVTMVEVQANGLPGLISDKVTKEIGLAENIQYLPLEKKVWVEHIVSGGERNRDGEALIRKAGYDIDFEANQLKEMYIHLFYMN